MKQKGLFELFFMLIMLVLFLPVATQKNVVTTPSAQAQANNLALLADYALADALADGTYLDCNLDRSTTLVSSYFTNLQDNFNSRLGTNCQITNIGSLAISDYIGTSTITCDSNSIRNKTEYKKDLKYSKQITFYHDINNYSCTETCTISIQDNYESPYTPVNKNTSQLISGCIPYVVFQDQFDSLNSSNWDDGELASLTVTSGKLEAIATVGNNSFSSAAIHTLSPRLTGEFTIVADLKLATPDSSNFADHLLYITGTEGNAYVGIIYDGLDLYFVADINGSSNFENFTNPPANVKLKIKRDTGNYLSVIIEESVSGTSLYNLSESFIPFTGNITDVRLVNFDNGSATSIPAKWDYITVQDSDQ